MADNGIIHTVKALERAAPGLIFLVIKSDTMVIPDKSIKCTIKDDAEGITVIIKKQGSQIVETNLCGTRNELFDLIVPLKLSHVHILRRLERRTQTQF
ncbi:MAG: hypothetical protein PHE24_04040 [Patescibacteria group bacterium]|nr:hypothetical protein [Patescibacteria group bacterium]